MKKIVFVDVVSLTFFLESLMLQQGADSSMVDGKFYFIYLTEYLHLNHFSSRSSTTTYNILNISTTLEPKCASCNKLHIIIDKRTLYALLKFFALLITKP